MGRVSCFSKTALKFSDSGIKATKHLSSTVSTFMSLKKAKKVRRARRSRRVESSKNRRLKKVLRLAPKAKSQKQMRIDLVFLLML